MNASDLPDETLFEGALKCRTPEERAAYLDQACAGQPALRRNLEALLQAHDQSGEFLEPTVAAARPTIKLDIAPEEASGTIIGRYKLLQKIGEGGMGVVYMAEQTEPVVRKVALKIIKLGMDTKAVVARFEAERQALALMDHPNIAKVLDAGATDTGRPYFVMELVHGVPITEYCDKNKLSTKERLELFIPVCQAIQHAHQKGIIHRDIKPSNVMVTLHDGVPVPKVIDFGVAKATNQRLTEKTLFTHYAQMIGTPAYMSPEQAEMSGLDIDTRSDIYSLGVLLYELLTGSTPFDAKDLLSKGYAEMQRIIAQQEPLKPSTRMNTMQHEEQTVVATNRSMEASALRKGLQGDLDWIVMRCLEKDRTRRYETSNGLAADLRRHLNTEPVLARPPSRLYEFQKAARRHKFGFAAAAAIILVLAGGVLVSSWQARRANRLVDELRSTAPAFAEQARALVIQSRFDEAIAKLDYAVKLRPYEAEYLVSKANLLQCQFKLDEAAAVYRAVLQLKPSHQRAASNARLCAELAASRNSTAGQLTREDLARLQVVMEGEQRSAAELFPVAQRLGEQKQLLLAYWLERLRNLPTPADKPLKERLAMNDAGHLVLDLSGVGLTDLPDLSGMPLDQLVLNGCKRLSNLSPLRMLPLRTLLLQGTAVSDLSPLREIPTLAALDLSKTMVTDLSPLRGLKLERLTVDGCNVADLTPLAGMPLVDLSLRTTRVASLKPLHGLRIKRLDLTGVPATDFDALSGLPLESLQCQYTRVRDLGFLKGMPLREISLWNCVETSNYSVFTNLPTLEVLQLPGTFRELPEYELAAIDAMQKLPNLKQIDGTQMDGMRIGQASTSEAFWRQWNAERAVRQGRHTDAQLALESILEESTRVNGPSHQATIDAREQLAKAFVVQDRPELAAPLFRTNIHFISQKNGARGTTPESFEWFRLAVTFVAAGDVAGYQRTCIEALPRFQDTANQFIAVRMIEMFSVGPDSTVEDSRMRSFNEVAKGILTGHWADWYRVDKGLWDYRANRWDEAAVELKAVSDKFPDAAAIARILLSMIDCRRGHPQEGQAQLKPAAEFVAKNWPPRDGDDWFWVQTYNANNLLREATALIESTTPPGANPDKP